MFHFPGNYTPLPLLKAAGGKKKRMAPLKNMPVNHKSIPLCVFTLLALLFFFSPARLFNNVLLCCITDAVWRLCRRNSKRKVNVYIYVCIYMFSFPFISCLCMYYFFTLFEGI
ncbi:hypothetical protein, unlikely [Trypanosoma brucei gambiense DAL972]|uniref:Uncharacterized protein n=1 Tax=Trypanosoma brucei gambiense (strain MHOM/CI/86/DAL972) TaxID=679716 RepID=D0A2K1_TRYB9|nr:hypothetical protein, unlikely [Trypanosoma brucei gambiense DAL972]CBH15495.1 hypothetical protein, unlikely [Trypanosoma brucei gambiense DAL972]|eukprot:XP_011777759.1 hypothetical protein, unlikely [Trypanosoma brucei gambiense DAL972]